MPTCALNIFTMSRRRGLNVRSKHHTRLRRTGPHESRFGFRRHCRPGERAEDAANRCTRNRRSPSHINFLALPERLSVQPFPKATCICVHLLARQYHRLETSPRPRGERQPHSCSHGHPWRRSPLNRPSARSAIFCCTRALHPAVHPAIDRLNRPSVAADEDWPRRPQNYLISKGYSVDNRALSNIREELNSCATAQHDNVPPARLSA